MSLEDRTYCQIDIGIDNSQMHMVDHRSIAIANFVCLFPPDILSEVHVVVDTVVNPKPDILYLQWDLTPDQLSNNTAALVQEIASYYETVVGGTTTRGQTADKYSHPIRCHAAGLDPKLPRINGSTTWIVHFPDDPKLSDEPCILKAYFNFMSFITHVEKWSEENEQKHLTLFMSAGRCKETLNFIRPAIQNTPMLEEHEEEEEEDLANESLRTEMDIEEMFRGCSPLLDFDPLV